MKAISGHSFGRSSSFSAAAASSTTPRKVSPARGGTLEAEHPDTLGRVPLLVCLQLDQDRAREALDLITPYEPAVRKAFTGGDARWLADFLTALGRARAGVGYEAERFRLAESNLLEAHPIYLAAKDRGPTHNDTLACVQALVDLNAARHTAEPGKGYDAKSAPWRAKLSAAEADSATRKQ